jgi:NAD(P)-dependent dehydrogenase (short-subunit alcohol dehydrogenase family)
VTDYDLGLRGKRALVTGAASGIGRATAQAFAEQGCRLVIADIQAGPLEDLKRELAGPKQQHLALPLDLADPAACESSIQTSVTHLRGLDIVVNAAAILKRQSLAEVSRESLQAMTAVNMWGPFFLARAAAQHMAQTGGGSITLFSSQGAYTGGYVGSTVYSMTKAAVAALIKSLAREYADRGVRVNGIAPGAIDTPMIHAGVTEEALARFQDIIPMHRLGSPQEVALTCAFLASPAAQYITGQMLHVNGGQLML